MLNEQSKQESRKLIQSRRKSILMLLYNEKYQEIDIDVLKKELKNDPDMAAAASQEEIENELGSYYNQAFALEAKAYGFNTMSLETADALNFSLRGTGKKILEKIKKFVCSILSGESTINEIIDAVLDALASIIPGGIIIKSLVKKLLKFILDKGITKFCSIPS